MPATICDQPSRIRRLTYEIREMWIRISSECPRSYVQNKHPQLGPFDHQAVGEVFSLGMPCSRRFETLISLISGVSRSLLAVCAQCSLSTFAGRKDAMSAVHSLHCGKATSDWRARSRLYFDMWTRIDTSWKYTGPECDYPRLFQTLSIVVEMLQVVTIWSV